MLLIYNPQTPGLVKKHNYTYKYFTHIPTHISIFPVLHSSGVELDPCQRRQGNICWVLQDSFGRPSPEGPAMIRHPNPSVIHSRGGLGITLPDQTSYTKLGKILPAASVNWGWICPLAPFIWIYFRFVCTLIVRHLTLTLYAVTFDFAVECEEFYQYHVIITPPWGKLGILNQLLMLVVGPYTSHLRSVTYTALLYCPNMSKHITFTALCLNDCMI